MGDGTETKLPKRYALKGTGDVKAMCPICTGRIFVGGSEEHSHQCDVIRGLVEKVDRLERALKIAGGPPRRKRRAPPKKKSTEAPRVRVEGT